MAVPTTDHAASLDALVDRLDPAEMDLPQGSARIRLAVGQGEGIDVVVDAGGGRIEDPRGRPDALLRADAATWHRMADDVAHGMEAFRARRLEVRHNLHLGVNFLAATSGRTDEERLRFARVKTKHGEVSALAAGSGPPIVMLHGLGATKAEFLPMLPVLAQHRRVIAVDLPGFGDSAKPLGASYDAKFFARGVVALLDELGLERTDVLGHSMGGRVALEMGSRHPERVSKLVAMTPSMPWLRDRRWAPWLRLVRPELGLLQPTPRPAVEAFVRRTIPGAESKWVAPAIDEFLRSYTTARGRAAFYAAARQIYLEHPRPFWDTLRDLEPPALFIWGRYDQLVPAGFARHVREALPAARHVTLRCGHVPQVERPGELNRALTGFLNRSDRP